MRLYVFGSILCGTCDALLQQLVNDGDNNELVIILVQS